MERMVAESCPKRAALARNVAAGAGCLEGAAADAAGITLAIPHPLRH